MCRELCKCKSFAVVVVVAAVVPAASVALLKSIMSANSSLFKLTLNTPLLAL